MVNNSETVESLNQLLQGEYMAIETFNNFISKLEDENSKELLKEIQKQHRENVSTLASHIQNIGGRPHENLGMKGTMADMKINMDLGLKADTNEIVEKVIAGETQGVNMAEKVLRGNLDDNSRNIAGQILENDRNSIQKLKTLM